MSGGPVLGTAALNRAVLARQLLLDRADLPVRETVQRVLGLNAQGPNCAYLALWTRLRGFRQEQLTRAVEDGEVLRSTMMRATQHFVSPADFRWLRPLLGPLLTRVQRSTFGRRTEGVDLPALVDEARTLLADGPLNRTDLGRRLAEGRPGADPVALGWTAQYLLPVVHPAPSGTWNVYGRTPFALPPSPMLDGDPQLMVRRYLAAFGPASVSDLRAWSGVAGLRTVVDGMRAELITFTGPTGRELFDLPDAPRPDPETPAPVRLLPEFDAPLLAYDDRTRMMSDEVRRQVCDGPAVYPTVLVDGRVRAKWALTGGLLTIEVLEPIAQADRELVEAEAADLLRFAAPDEQHDVRWTI